MVSWEYMKVTQYQINEINLDKVSNKELTIAIMEGTLNSMKIGEYVEENRYYNPVIYKAAKLSNWFGEPKRGYNWYDGEEGSTRENY